MRNDQIHRGRIINSLSGYLPSPWQFCSLSSCVTSPDLSLASPYKREPSQRLRPTPLGASVVAALSLDQRLVCETLPGAAIDKAVKPSKRVVFDVAFVQSERELIDVAVKMLRACMMINADDAALEDCEDAFHSVRGHVIANSYIARS